MHFFGGGADFVGVAVAVEEGDGAAAFLGGAAGFLAVILEGFPLGRHLGEEVFVGLNELVPKFGPDDLQVADDPAAVGIFPIDREAEQVAQGVEIGEEGEGAADEGAEVAAAVGFGNWLGRVARIKHQTLQQNQIPRVGLDFGAVIFVCGSPDLPELRPCAEVNPLAGVGGGDSVVNVTAEGDAAVVGGAFLPAVQVGEGGVEPGVEGAQVRGEQGGKHRWGGYHKRGWLDVYLTVTGKEKPGMG